MTLIAEQLSSAVSGLLMIMVAIDGNRIVTQVNVRNMYGISGCPVG